MIATLPRHRALALIGRGVWIELIRRKDLYVLSILMSVFVFGTFAASIVGIKNASTATFLLNLGLTLAYYAAHILTLLLVARQVPDELDSRMLHPLLAKPIDRATYLLGKWAACSLCGCGVFLALGGVAWLATPKMDHYFPAMMAQALALQAASMSLFAAIALLLSLLVPKGVNIVLCGLLAALGGKILAFFKIKAAGSAAFGVLLAAVPDFSRLNVLTRYTDGIVPLSSGEFLLLIAEGSFFAAFFLAAAIVTFDRRPL